MEKKYGCCGAQIWCSIIASIQIVGSALCLLLLTIALVFQLHELVIGIITSLQNSPPPLIQVTLYADNPKLVNVLMYIALGTEVGLGFWLLNGIRMREPNFIGSWIILEFLSLLTALAFFTANIFTGRVKGQLCLYIFRMCLNLPIQGFCMWMASLYRLEVIKARKLKNELFYPIKT